MTEMRIALLSVILLVMFPLITPVLAQQLEYRQGEVLIQVPVGESQETLKQKISPYFERSESYLLEQITDAPLNVWRLGIDYTQRSETELMHNLESSGYFLSCQKNKIAKRRAIPNDPDFDELWHHLNAGQDGGLLNVDYDAELAWDLATGGSTINGDEIVLAVIDDGIDELHEDLVNNIWVNTAEIEGNDIDDDLNGYVDDYYGWDTDRDNNDIFDQGAHAVPLYGIIGAEGNNELGVVGVNWKTKIMMVQGGGDEASALAAYTYPYKFRKLYNETNGNEGAFVVATNSSFGLDNVKAEETPLWCAFFDSLGTVGILSTGATTNENTNVDVDGDVPTTCTSDYFIGVTNLNRRNEKVRDAGYGKKSVDLGAFGEDIYTTAIGNKYKTSSGTSEATPFVTGLIGLLYSYECSYLADLAMSDPPAAALLVKNAILSSVVEVPDLVGITVTGGRMNMNNAMRLLADVCEDCGTIINSSVNDRTDETAAIDWVNGNGNTGVNIRWRLTGSSTWLNANNVTSPYTIMGLQGCRDYEYQFQSICGSETTGWSTSFKFASEGCCVLPEDITFEVIGSAAQLQWNSIFASREYLIEYKPITQAAYNKEFITENQFSFVMAESCSAYNVRMKVICNGQETIFSETLLIKNDCGVCSSSAYCDVPGKDNTFEWIDTVRLGDTFYATGQNETTFGDFTNVYSFEVVQGEEIDLKISPGFQTSGDDENYGVFIDWDQNERFDNDELVFLTEDNKSDPVTTIITVPENARIGVTRMRVMMVFRSTVRACGSSGFSFGEIEDYCLFVNEIPGECDIETNLRLKDATKTDAVLAWDKNEAIISYAIRYKPAIAENWIELNELADTIKLPNLTKCTDYEAQIKNTCSIDTSTYSKSLFFKTKCTDATSQLLELQAKVFPNPFMDVINIQFKKEPRPGLMQLVNIKGQIVGSKEVGPRDSSYQLDTHTLQNGIYFIRYLSENQVAYKKLIKF